MTHDCLSSEAQGFDDGPVAFNIVVLYIVEEPAAPANHHQKPSAGMMIFFVRPGSFMKLLTSYPVIRWQEGETYANRPSGNSQYSQS